MDQKRGKLVKIITPMQKRIIGRGQPLCLYIEFEVDGVKIRREISDQIALRIKTSTNIYVPGPFVTEWLPSMPLPEEIYLKEGRPGQYSPTVDLYDQMALWLKSIWAIEREAWKLKRKTDYRKACA